MDTMIMNSENSKSTEPYRLLVNLADKIDLKRSDKFFALSNLSMYYIWKKNKGNHIITISFKYPIQHRTKNLNYPENRITFEVKRGYYLQLLTPETMKLLGSTEVR